MSCSCKFRDSSEPYPPLLEELRGKVDIILSNPPYIPQERIGKLEKSVGEWEDPRALFAGPDGTSFHTAVIRFAKQFLRQTKKQELLQVPDVVMEIDGEHQREELERLASVFSGHVSFNWDSAGKCRVVKLSRSTRNRGIFGYEE